MLSQKKRIKWAFKFGKIEHTAGRATGLAAIIAVIAAYGTKTNMLVLMFTIITCLLWWVYLIAHNVEKYLFGSNGPRSGWGKKK